MIPWLMLLACTPSKPPLASFHDARVGDLMVFTYTRHLEDFREGWDKLVLLDTELLLELEVVALEEHTVWLLLRASDPQGSAVAHPALAQDLLIPIARVEAYEPNLAPSDGRIDAGARTWRYTTSRQDDRPQGGWLTVQGRARPIGPMYLTRGLLLLERTSGTQGKVLDEQRLVLVGLAPGQTGQGSLPQAPHLLELQSWFVEGRWSQQKVVATRTSQSMQGALLLQTRTTYRPADAGAASTNDCLQLDQEVVCRDALPPSSSSQELATMLMELAALASEPQRQGGLLTQQGCRQGPVPVRSYAQPTQAFLDGESITGKEILSFAQDPHALKGLPLLRALEPLGESREFPFQAMSLDTRSALWDWSAEPL